MTEVKDDEYYYCVGVCMPDPDSGYCLGCGRPAAVVTNEREAVVVEELRPTPQTPVLPSDPDTSQDA